jgi:hypothetical protein
VGDTELLGVVLQEVLGGVQLGLGSAAAHKGHVLDGSLGNQVGDNVLDVVQIDIVHDNSSRIMIYV